MPEDYRSRADGGPDEIAGADALTRDPLRFDTLTITNIRGGQIATPDIDYCLIMSDLLITQSYFSQRANSLRRPSMPVIGRVLSSPFTIRKELGRLVT